ncbi:MAG: hypothetical protein U1F61_23750 [Opitutaceae bacterium]
MAPLPACPFLPPCRPGLDWRALHQHRHDNRGAAFYFDCLEYGQSLWQRRFAARALLCLDRAMGAELMGNEPVLTPWPMPYAALAWIITHTPPDLFLGNPRVHFQHYADRMNEPRKAQRQWRAWACWAVVRAVRPDWPNDPKHPVVEPTYEAIKNAIELHGIPGEAALWAGIVGDPTLAQRG